MGIIPARPLRAEDMQHIDLDIYFEISDGKLEIHTERTAWHQQIADAVQDVLKRRYPLALRSLNRFRWRKRKAARRRRQPEPVELVLRDRVHGLRADQVEVIVEVVCHDLDPRLNRRSVDRDRVVKFREYATAGIPEYWIVDEDPSNRCEALVEIYHLRDHFYAPKLVTKLSQLTTGAVEPPQRATLQRATL